MAAAYEGKMYVIGGMNDENSIVRDVSVFDPQTRTWSEAPELPESGPADGFAPAAGVHDGRLYVSAAYGTLWRLAESGREWEKTGSATPRVAHRIASKGEMVLVLGGAAKGKNLDLIEAVPVSGN